MENKIKINECEYISIEEHDRIIAEKIKEGAIKVEEPKKKAKRFTPLVASGILRELDNIFSAEGGDTLDEDDAIKKDIAITDPANVLMVIGKSEEAKRLLCIFISPESDMRKMPDLSFISNDKPASSLFSFDYFYKIISVLNVSGCDSIRISVNNDHPIKLENKHFAFILAPRIEDE